MGTLDNPGKYDCLARLDRDEPYFLLMARDENAPALVWLWATMRELSECADAAKIDEARRCCIQMMEWQQARGRRGRGFGQAVMAGIMDMIRTINGTARAQEAANKGGATSLEFMRHCLAVVDFGTPEQLAEESRRAEAAAAAAERVGAAIEAALPAALGDDAASEEIMQAASVTVRVSDLLTLREAARL